MDNFAVLHCCFHELGAHHCAVIGNGVVEGQDIEWRHLRFVADTHPGQGGLGEITFFRATYVGLAFSGYLQVERAVYADALQAVHKLLRIVAVMFVDEMRNADVG